MSLGYEPESGIREGEIEFLEQYNSEKGTVITYSTMIRNLIDYSDGYYPLYIFYFYDEKTLSLNRKIEELRGEEIKEENKDRYFDNARKQSPERDTLLRLYKEFGF